MIPVQYAKLVGNDDNCHVVEYRILQVQPGRNVTVTFQTNKMIYQMSK